MAVPAKKKRSAGGAGKPKNTVAEARGARGARAARGSERRSSSWELFKSVAGTLAIFFFIRIFLVEAFRIPSESMVPTLLVGDWLFVNKLVYGPRIPFTMKHLPGYADPRRGEVVVFMSPYQADEAAVGNDPTPTLVKRLVGVPGDTLFMRHGQLYVNGMPQRQDFTNQEPVPPGAGDQTDYLFAWQHQVELRNTRFGPPPATPTHDDWGPLLVPPRRYFMMGDNRYHSKDSRYWGLVPRENVEGRPMFVYYSYDPDEGTPYLRALTAIRWSRIGHRIR